VLVLFKLLGNKRLFILLVAFIFFIALMGLTLGKREDPTLPEKVLQDTVGWVQGLFYKPAGYIAGFFENIRHLRVTYEENAALRKTLAHYANDSARLSQLEAENKRLKELLNFTDSQKQYNEYKYHVAEVIGFSSDPFNNTVKINLGSAEGMKEDMVVVTTKGLIGRIVRVSTFVSTVQLITDIDSRVSGTKAIAVTAQGKEDVSFGMIERYDRDKNLLVMEKISIDDPLAEGDIVVSSGLGQVFPKAVIIGTVVSRQEGEFGLAQTAYVKPLSDLHHLREVLVIEQPVTYGEPNE
jgi:rod shape-determining protein MreC